MIFSHAIFDSFLGERAAGTLLDFAISSEARFETSIVYSEDGPLIDSASRRSLTLAGDWAEASADLRAAIEARSSEILSTISIAPFELAPIELQLVASRDGDFFECHSDTGTGDGRMDADRIVSAVYYFYSQPKAFSGGELILHGLGGAESESIKPLHDRLVAFPSFAPHEVAPVRLPGNAFVDARFSINCWLSRQR